MNLENLFKFSMGSESMKSFITVAETVSLNSKYQICRRYGIDFFKMWLIVKIEMWITPKYFYGDGSGISGMNNLHTWMVWDNQ